MIDWLPPHKCGLYLEHNAHKDVYYTVEQYCNPDDFVSMEEWDKAEPEQEPFMVVAPECAERGCMAHDDRVDGSGIVVQLRKEQEEVRRLHAELERKSDAIQRLWKERDELLSETRTLVRQNGEWQELTAELVEALRSVVAWMDAPDESAFSDTQLAAARAALAKVEASK